MLVGSEMPGVSRIDPIGNLRGPHGVEERGGERYYGWKLKAALVGLDELRRIEPLALDPPDDLVVNPRVHGGRSG